MSENEVVEHGVEVACYTNGWDGYRPVFRCICGFGTSYQAESWQEAGEEFDRHLEGHRGVGEAR
jgi:hypothetical protein